MIKKTIQIDIKVNANHCEQYAVSPDGKQIAFIREEHQLVILSQDANSNYESNTFMNNLFNVNKGGLEIVGNHLCWWIFEDSKLKVIIIEIGTKKLSLYNQYIEGKNAKCFANGCLYEIIEGNLAVTDFTNESKVKVFQRNYLNTNLIYVVYHLDPHLFITIQDQIWRESIPIQDDGGFQVPKNYGHSYKILQNHTIRQQPSTNSIKLISQKNITPTNAKTININKKIGFARIAIYKQILIVQNSRGIMTISRITNLKMLRNQRLEYHSFYIQNNYFQISYLNNVYSVIDLRTSRITNYEDTQWFTLRQDRIIQFKSDSLFIHFMNS